MLLHLVTLLNAYLSELKREEGQGMAEYALIIALVSIAAIAALTALGPLILAAFNDVVAGF
jgi:pilus assembly protein Flp/PilA